MKKLITSIAFTLLFALGAMAQGNFTITGSVLDSLGGAVANQQVCIYTDSSQTSFVYYNCVNTNSSGQFVVVIPNGSVTGPNIIFYVYTMSCNSFLLQQVQNNQGTSSGASVTFLVCGSALNACSTMLYAAPDSFSTIPFTYGFYGYATQNGTSANVASYSWDFGDSSALSTLAYPQHTYLISGVYTACLTTTTTTGCTSTACITVNTIPVCNANFGINLGVAGSNSYFTALWGANYYYFWTFGDGSAGIGQNPNHIYTNSGTYSVCLTVVDSVAGCSDNFCYAINISGVQPTSTLYGQVNLTGLGFFTAADYGKVYLIRQDSLLLTAIDTTLIDSGGYYFFSNVSAGIYLVKAALDSNSAYYSSFLPTYHTSSLFWVSASNVFVNGSSVAANIAMIPGTNPGGPGFIGGSVLQGANRMASPGDPIVGINILLLNMNNSPVTCTTTDASGNYSFPNIAYGTYQVYAEVAGKTTVPSIVTINAANPTVSNVNVEVNSGNILIVKPIVADEAAFGVYPNPASDYLSVSVDLKEATWVRVDIENLVGQVVQRNGYQLNAGKHNITESLTALPKGMYSISVTDNTKRTSSKFVKAEY